MLARSTGSMALRNATRNRALQQASVIMPPSVIMTYGIRREPVPICARLDYVRTPGLLRDRQSFQRRGPSGGTLFGRAGNFWLNVTDSAFAVTFARAVVAFREQLAQHPGWLRPVRQRSLRIHHPLACFPADSGATRGRRRAEMGLTGRAGTDVRVRKQ